MTESTDNKTQEISTEKLQSRSNLLEVKIAAFNTVLEHTIKEVVLNNVTLEASAFMVQAHNFYTQILSNIKKEFEHVKGLLAKRAEAEAAQQNVPAPEVTAPAIAAEEQK